MDKAEFLDTLRRERAAWDALLAQVPADRMTQAGAVGHWSIKDLIAHVTWYENEMVDVLKTRTFKGSPWWELDNTERNAHIFEQVRDLPLDKVLADAKTTYEQLVTELEKLPEESLHDPTHFSDMPLEWKPWEVIASNCYEHYPQHTDDVKNWIQKKE